jgi:signal transduction histidine kinase
VADRRNHPSLERRLIWRIALLYVAAFLLASMGYLIAAWHNQTVDLENDMGDIATSIARSVVREADGKLRFDISPALAQRIRETPELVYGALDITSGKFVEGSTLTAPPLLPGPDVPGEFEGDFAFRGPDGTVQYGSIRLVPTPIGQMRVALLRSEPTFKDLLTWLWHQSAEATLPIFIPLTIATLLIVAQTIRGTIRPVRSLSHQASRLGTEAIGLRLAEDRAPREILPLVSAMNTAIERLETALMQQQRFTAYAAHALRTPLSVLRARIDGLDDPEQIARLAADVDRMARVVNQMLGIARLQARQVSLDESINLTALVRDVLAAIAPVALAQGKDVALAAPEAPVQVRGNANALEEALTNLIDNALAHTPPGRAVEVGLSAEALLEVRDHGPGVRESVKARLFEPFWRADDSKTRGAGLGLAIVAEIAQLHHGAVTVENHPEGGAIFRLTLSRALIGVAPRPAEPTTVELAEID